MSDPWDNYREINNKVIQTTSNNPWELYQSNEQPELEQGGITASVRNTINRVKNISNIVGLGLKLMVGGNPSEEQQKVYDALKQGQLNATEGNVKAGHDIAHPFDNVSIKDTAKRLWAGIADAGGALASDPSGTLNKGARTLLEMPGNLIESIVGDVFGSMSGVALDGSTVRAYTPEEHAAKVKGLIANAAAAAVAPMASKLLTGVMGGRGIAGEVLEGMSTPKLASIAAQPDKLGVMGRAIISDAGAAVASGMTQGAIQNANTPEVLSGMAAALLFAPIGVLTGWYRGVTGHGDAFTATKEGAAQIKLLRDWQNLENANVDGARIKVEKLLTSDDIEQALKNIRMESAETLTGVAAKNRTSGELVSNTTFEGGHSALPGVPEAFQARQVGWEDGYVTSTGRFVNREEALQIARERGQLRQAGTPAMRGGGTYQGIGTRTTLEAGDVVRPAIDDLYNEFKKTLNEKDSFASSLVNFLEKNNLKEHTNELLEKFATKYAAESIPAEELSSLRELIKSNRESIKPFTSEHDLLTEANRRGFFYTNEFGAIKIRDIETGEVMGTAKNTKEAMEFLRETGNPANPLLMDANSPVPSIGIPAEPISPNSNPHPHDDWEPLKNNPSAKVAGLDLKVNPITATNGFIEAIDRLNDTNFKHGVFEPIERANRLTNVAIHEDLESGRMRLIDAFVRSGKSKIGFASRFKPEELEAIGLAMEAQSWDEMIQPNGYARNYTIPQEAQTLAKFMHENNVDATKVLYYRRASAAAKYHASLEAQKRAAGEMKFNIDNLGAEEAGKIYEKTINGFENSVGYQAVQAQIEGAFKPDANFMKAVQQYDNLFKLPDGSAHAGAATRLKLALERPDTHGISQADFIKQHNMSPDQVRLLGMLEEAYEHFGSKFGIKDSRKFLRYMNHYRQYGDILDSYVVGDFEKGIMDGSMRQFASAMIRTGEVANYSLNPVANLQAYIRAGNKSQSLYPVLDETLTSLDATIKKELSKINDPVMKDMVIDRFNSYQRDVSGRGSVSNEQALHISANVLKEMVLDENGKRMTSQEIINEMKKPDKADALLSLSSAGLLGGRMSLALRDNYDVWQKFYIKHGAQRLGNLMRTRVNDNIIDALVTRGDITRPSAQDVYNVVASEGKTGAFNAAARELADVGFKTSLQGHFYMRNQAAVWIETTRNTNKVLGEISKGTLTKEKAYEKLFLNSYDIPTQRIFNSYVNSGQYEAASRLLAGQEVRSVVGTFSRGNQAPVLNSTPGKFLGQLGSWSMTNRSVFENMMTRGTKKEIIRSMARYATTVAGTVAAGRATGLNLGAWLLLPTSFIATGGPAMQAIKATGAELQAELGGNEAQINYTRRNALTSLTQFMPFSYLIKDVKKAAKLASDGYGYGAMRPLAQAIGIGVNTSSRNVLDLVQGNYPIPPE